MTMTIGTWSADSDGQIRIDNQVYQQNKYGQQQVNYQLQSYRKILQCLFLTRFYKLTVFAKSLYTYMLTNKSDFCQNKLKRYLYQIKLIKLDSKIQFLVILRFYETILIINNRPIVTPGAPHVCSR